MGITEDWMVCHLHWLIGISLSDRLMLKAGLVLIICMSSLREGGVISSISVGLQSSLRVLDMSPYQMYALEISSPSRLLPTGFHRGFIGFSLY